ncbi:alpha/beta hydrolase [Corynebacterium sp. YIM 101645]|uniref:prolyl aminopeptidase n=1 Tax=Corynebacterium lemuris TaxID=1859292 RepID=A0ABT2FY35_9CORY|nr:alpha/beta hydrolase [Corynebacterium lemuris]MCS5479934.1 alpha/beta hydrolase [Corynebacterium lemuris]
MLVICLGLGGLVGVLTANRWMMLLAPVIFMTAFELARIPATGPTVDGVYLGSVYGIMALLVGRGVDLMVMGLPLAVGALWGAAGGRRRTGKGARSRLRTGRYLRALGAVLVTVPVVVLVAALLRPATTEPITGPDGEVLPQSVAELVTLQVGDHEQSMLLRGHDRGAPVLLFLEGGPGGTAIGAMRASGQRLEEDFVLAVWDQRGTGKSLPALEPTETLTVEQMISDTLEVTDYLRGRFGQERIYLVGSSWGSTLGVLATQQAPDKYHAFIGTGQMVDQQETDRRMYAETLDWAQRTGNEDFVGRLRDNGPPPYADMLAYPDALSTNPEHRDFPHGEDYNPASAYPASLLVPEYALIEQVRAMGGIIDTFSVLYPQLQDINFRRDVPRLEVPVFLVLGEYESPGRSDLAVEWFGQLEAPTKELVVFPQSGHTPHLDEPSRFHEFMSGTVLAGSDPSR